MQIFLHMYNLIVGGQTPRPSHHHVVCGLLQGVETRPNQGMLAGLWSDCGCSDHLSCLHHMARKLKPSPIPVDSGQSPVLIWCPLPVYFQLDHRDSKSASPLAHLNFLVLTPTEMHPALYLCVVVTLC